MKTILIFFFSLIIGYSTSLAQEILKSMRYTLLFLLAFLFFGCKKNVETECGTLRCPPLRITVQLSVVDTDGKPAKAAYIETINTRTGRKRTNLQNGPDYIATTAYKYNLFQRPSDFSSAGDLVEVLVRSQSGKEYKLTYVIKGGKCTCDLEKLSGPEILVLD